MGLAALLLAVLGIVSAAAQAPPSPGAIQDGLGVPSSSFSPGSSGPISPFSTPPAFSPSIARSACPAATYPINVQQLVNQSETQCVQNVTGGDEYGRFGRQTPFGFKYMDTGTAGCDVLSVTIAVQAGVSCSGLASGGNLTFNGRALPGLSYRFPYVNEYNRSCTCVPTAPSPIQVFTFNPGSNYMVGSNNTFSILGSTGSNGLRPIFTQQMGGIYGVVIVNQWVATGFMNVPRTSFGWDKTQNDSALAAGGITSNMQITNTSETFDESTLSWTPTVTTMPYSTALNSVANLQGPDEAPDSTFSYYTITAGGFNQQNQILQNATIFNSTSRVWTSAPNMNLARFRFQLTSLYNNTNAVVATGGLQGFFGEQQALASAETYDLDTNSWMFTANNMSVARYRHAAVRIPDPWAILVIGGQGTSGQALNSTEKLNPDTTVWTTTGSMIQARYAFAAVTLLNGSVLVCGGAQRPNADSTWADSDLMSSAEIYVNGTWYSAGNMNSPRADHEATVLSDGTVLVAGGGGDQAQSSSEIWDPRNGHWTPAAPMLIPRVKFGLVTFNNDKTLSFGGSTDGSLGLINGTTTSALFAPAFNLSLISTTISPAIGPAFAPEEGAAAPSPESGTTADPREAPDNDGATNATSVVIYQTSGGISGGAIGGIVGGVLGGAILIAAAVWLLLRRRKKKRLAAAHPTPCIHNKQNAGVAGAYKDNDSSRSPSPDSQSPSAGARHNGGILGRLAAFARIPAVARRGAARQPEPAKANSVELPKGIASPFGGDDTAPATNGIKHGGASARSLGSASAANSVEMRAGLPSPFDDVDDVPNGTPATSSTNGRRSAGEPLTGASWDPVTQTTGGSSSARDEDGFDPSRMGMIQLHGNSSQRSARSAVISRESAVSVKSDLSRVSITINNELNNVEWRINRSTLELGKRLGKGGFGEVFEGFHHGSSVAIKILEIDDERTMRDACHEFGFLHGLRHSKLVVSYGACVDGNQMMLVMERMEEDLFHAIASNETSAKNSVLWFFRGWRIALDIASALVFLHSKGLVHLDVKSLNILLKSGRTEAKLGDLGLARLVPDGRLALQNTLPGTPAYSAPEVIQAQLQWRLRTQGRKDQFKTEVGMPADIFSFGVVLFEICTGTHPARWRQDFTGEFRPEQAPPAIAKLVDDCLNDDPELRPTAADCLKVLLDNRPVRH